MCYISIVFSIFALLGGMHLLAKTKKELLGKFFIWISYLIIVVSLALIICQCTHGMMRMCCHRNACPPSECSMPGMMHHCGMMKHCEMGGGKCCMEMQECKMKSDSACCDKMKHGKCADMEKKDDDGAKKDSLKK